MMDPMAGGRAGDLARALEAAKKVIYGQDSLLEAVLSALVCGGHVLIEGMPGLGKTMSVRAMARLCALDFKRIQFTPDLLPSDLVGTMIYSQQREEFTTKFGPVFTQLLLADEINRSPAKVQAALLEAMAERQVTIGEETHRLGSPFVVLATQNPVDQEGTYSLPEAQMDRFMMKVDVGYPPFEAELGILDLKEDMLADLSPVLSAESILAAKEEVEKIYCDEKIKSMIVRVVQATRPGDGLFPKSLRGRVQAGASPRASLWLYHLSRFRAYLDGKDFVSPEHLLGIIPDVMGHRIMLTYEAAIDRADAKEIALRVAKDVM